MVKVREGEEAPPAAPPTVTLTPTSLSDAHAHQATPMGVLPSPASSLSASGPVSPASSVNSTGEAYSNEDLRPYHHRGHGYHHHHHNNNHHNNSHHHHHHHHQPSWGGGRHHGTAAAHARRHSPHHHHTYHHTYHHTNGHYHHHHHHHHRSSGSSSSHYHNDDGYYGGGYHQGGGHKAGYQDAYQGYQGGYHGGYSGGSRGRRKSPREDPWASSLSVGGGRGGGGRYKSISPTPCRSRGVSPRSQCYTPSPSGLEEEEEEEEEGMGSVTVEVGGGGGLVGGLEEGLLMGLGEEGQHVVHLHINPGTTVNFTTDDGQVQRISGPASVRMVSTNSSPPIPLPVQVPPGHVVQQIVDETGTLRHVILSTQPVPMTMCPYGPNTGQAPPQFFGPPLHGPPPQGYVQPYQPPPQYTPVVSPPLAQPSPPPIYNPKSDRHVRQYDKPRTKYYQRQQLQHHNKSGTSSLHSTPPLSPKKEPLVRKNGGEEEIHAEDGEDTRSSLQHLLSQVKPPKVIDVTPHEAVIQWSPPDLSGHHDEMPVSELLYDVFLNNNLYRSISATRLTIAGLKPATEYRVYFQCLCGNVRGDSSGTTAFHTHSTVPDAPQLPRMVHKSKTALHFRWSTVKENGSPVTAFILELCGNSGEWTEVYRGRGKQHNIVKLQPNTRYRVRLAAVNEHGRSEYSPETIAYTSGVAPSQPAPPVREHASVTSLSLGWTKRPMEETYTLQMEDSLNGYGFRPVYNGRDTRFTCSGLRRNADYKFRLCAHNDEGTSPFSDITCCRTLPDRPKPPSAPNVKGRAKSTKLMLIWSPPSDHGGSPVTAYRVELNDGSGFKCIYSGEATETECTELSPGRSYHVRALCESLGGISDWSDTATVTTEAVCPGICQAPRLLGKPKASLLQLKWGHPEYDGGAPVTEFHIEMMAPDNERRQVYCGRDLECTVASLLPGRPYIFLVRGVNRIGFGPWSEPLEVVSGAGPPDAPHAPHLACRSPYSVHLVWEEPINNGAGIDQYNVQIAEVSCPHAESSESSSTCGDIESDLTFNSAYTGSATTTEVRNLAPATTYAFRVCCSNSAGVGPWSSHATVTTPAAPPASVAYISSSPAATAVTLLWGEPANHGDPITHYVIEVGEKTVTTPGPETEYTLTELQPETLHRIRIQAMNSVGPGGFSGIHKVMTKPLPPAPPTIELVKASYNSLKLKWGDGRNLDMLTYSLQMEFTNFHNGTREFYQVYNGTNQNYKVVRLEENTEYRLRICASNEAGVGPYSAVAHLSTTKAAPPPLKAPRVTESPDGSHIVEWCSVRCPGEDSIVYRLQMLQAGKDQDYSSVFTGSETSYSLRGLEPQSGYYVRVCGVRVCGDGETMAGAYSSPTLFNTPKPVPVTTTKTPTNTTQEVGLQWHNLSDQQKAAAILVVFSLFCAVAAIGLHHFLAPDTGR